MKQLFIILLSVSFFVVSCEKTENNPYENGLNSDEANTDLVTDAGKHIGNISDKNLDNLHKEVSKFSDILRDMYSNEVIRSEVNAAILAGYYSDENVLLADLIHPEKSQLYKKMRVKSYRFKDAFYTLVYDKRARVVNDNFDEYLINNGVSIYFPYSENFKDQNRKDITIVMPPKADVNGAEGIRLVQCGEKVCEEKVFVDDSYAMNNPTHIIYAGGVKVKDQYVKKLKNTRSTTSINQVYVGAVRCKEQYDNLISLTGNGGGSEIKFFRGSGYLASGTDGQVTSPTGDLLSADFSRSEINNCNFKVINGSWDIDWVPENLEQVFGIYEEDNKGTKTFTGSINTTVKVFGQNVNGTLGYNISVQTQDDIIRNWKITRNAFYIANGVNQGYGLFSTVGGLSGGPWAAWDGAVGIGNCTGANVSFVLPTITN